MVVLFTSKATTSGGREGHVKSEDGLIDLQLTTPSALNKKTGSNPEQLFAAGYSACFDGALNFIAKKNKHKIESSITAEVSLLKDETESPFSLAVTLNAHIKGVPQDVAVELVKEAHGFCPYSKALRNNVDVKLKVSVE
ncbi:organic hydroperoxide resistance protein [Gottfriedia solisilvae]|uniref:Organic hydroperoxide resistance protein OhrB n=1 Tax=Gottfriedia solisilvae TaxID=1516104 RepID=A0A8J3AED6_9BACI|nr:organic hydroperoxide resistance protein [Gottfriedia solisilvae]GGI12807.1 organic hydroperoxide resistance protein OhrB [Gottfriedia solisilvae]